MKKTNDFLRITFCLVSTILVFASNLFAEVEILSVTPSGSVEGTDAAYNITITFNQPMVPLGKLPEGDGTGPLIIEPKVLGKYRWQGTTVLSFKPSDKSINATEYKITVPKGVKSEISGEVLEQDYGWTFETLRPDLIMSFPYEDSDWVELNLPIFLKFNQQIDPDKAKPYIKLVEHQPDGKSVELNFTLTNMTSNDFVILREVYHSYEEFKGENTLVLTLRGSLKKDCYYTLELLSGLPAKEGNLGLINNRIISFRTYKTFKFIRPNSWDNLNPLQSLMLQFTNPVKISDLVKNIELRPETKIPEYLKDAHHFSYCDKSCQCCPIELGLELKPNTKYYIKIKGSLTDKYGQELGNDIDTYFVTKDYIPWISMPTGIGIVERYIEPIRHPIKLMNVDKLRLQMALIDTNNIVPLVTGGVENNHNAITPPGGYKIDYIWEPKIVRNQRKLLPIELKEILGENKFGIVFIQAESLVNLNDGSRFRQALLQITSLGLTGKFSPDGNLIYVSYLKTGLPVKGCSIELRNNNNDILWTSRTNDDGFCKTPGWEELNIVPKTRWEKPKLFVIAKNGPDVAFIHSDWGTGIYPYHFNIDYEWSPEYPKYNGHIFTERGIYRPSEIVYIK